MKTIDLTGQRFGDLTVIERAGSQHNHALWKCKCKCGKEILVTQCNLKWRKQSSCGCVNKQREAADITGRRFNHLTVIGRDASSGKNKWLCQCDCGNIVSRHKSSLTSGESFSCGCIKKPKNSTPNSAVARIKRCRAAMINRCNNPNSVEYHRYGGRGIKVCDEWLGKNGVKSFVDWSLKNGYEDGLSIDRIDNNGDYTPRNCRWSTSTEQCRNKSTNRMLTVNGETRCLAEWCEIYGVSHSMFHGRVKKGWSIEEAIGAVSRNHQNKRYITIGSETKIMKRWAEEYGISESCLCERIKAGWTAEEAVKTPVGKTRGWHGEDKT